LLLRDFLSARDLPEFVELTESSLDELHTYLAGKVQASEPAITVEKIARPHCMALSLADPRRP
jgi:hypothetical protein